MSYATPEAIAVLPIEDMLTVPDAARRLQVNQETVRRRIRDGSLQAQKLGNQWFINLEDLDTFKATYDRKTGRRTRLF